MVFFFIVGRHLKFEGIIEKEEWIANIKFELWIWKTYIMKNYSNETIIFDSMQMWLSLMQVKYIIDIRFWYL